MVTHANCAGDSRGHWEALCQSINSTQPDADEQQFKALFHNAHQRQPTEAGVTTWQSLVLTEAITVQRPLTRAEYTAAARIKMLRTITGAEQPAHSATDKRSSTLEVFTPASSPPRPKPTPTTAVSESSGGQHRTSITTSPNLGDKRRGRILGDKASQKTTQKEQLLATRRSSRGHTSIAPESLSCCYSRCKQTRPSIVDNLMCSHAHRPMHTNCAAPVSDPNQDRYCIDCQAQQNQC